ncbi:hypothetical protein ACEWY4_017957 [Coilia grayii]|uniref:Fibrinogen C-terminal domain-containing protein n=1 Tax=Coilia grayii TaxID=363190 RepID=A0ABD1JLS5_9TELE
MVQSHLFGRTFLPIDCEEYFQNGTKHNGVYTIYPAGEDSAMEVYCDMGCTENEDHEGGQWTVIQRREDGSVNFHRPWGDYKEGFGNKSGEYWLGLQNIYLLTWGHKYELKVEMEDFEGGKVFALYSSFAVESEDEGYRLRVMDFNDGGAGDSLQHQNGARFSAFDRDQDNIYVNCADYHRGGFWFNQCYYYYYYYYYYFVGSSPNGDYKWKDYNNGYDGVIWGTWKGTYYSLKSITMKIKRVPLPEVD